MPAYKAPLRDIRFLMNEVLDYPAHYQKLSNGEYADADTVDMILEGAADFCENVLSPLNQTGDAEGCHFENGEVAHRKASRKLMISSCKVAGKVCLILKNLAVKTCRCL
jgi:Acyl-CoA dehydrogenase N terminal.